MSTQCPGAKACEHCGTDNMIVEGVHKSVICLTCCASGPSAMGIAEYNGFTHPADIARELWNTRKGRLKKNKRVMEQILKSNAPPG